MVHLRPVVALQMHPWNGRVMLEKRTLYVCNTVMGEQLPVATCYEDIPWISR